LRSDSLILNEDDDDDDDDDDDVVFQYIFSQPSIYIDGWLWHEDDVCRL